MINLLLDTSIDLTILYTDKNIRILFDKCRIDKETYPFPITRRGEASLATAGG